MSEEGAWGLASFPVRHQVPCQIPVGGSVMGGGVVLSEANLAKKQSSCLFYAS